MENKYLICSLLQQVLKLTVEGRDIMSLEYSDALETVLIKYSNGSVRVANVDGDSGLAMIVNIINVIK